MGFIYRKELTFLQNVAIMLSCKPALIVFNLREMSLSDVKDYANRIFVMYGVNNPLMPITMAIGVNDVDADWRVRKTLVNAGIIFQDVKEEDLTSEGLHKLILKLNAELEVSNANVYKENKTEVVDRTNLDAYMYPQFAMSKEDLKKMLLK